MAVYTTALATVPDTRAWPEAASLASRMLFPTALTAAVFLVVASRIYPRDRLCWLAAGVTMVGVQGVPVLAAIDSRSHYADDASLFSAALVGLAVLAVARAAQSHRLLVPPVPVGLAIGLVLLAVRAAWNGGLRSWLYAEVGWSSQRAGLAPIGSVVLLLGLGMLAGLLVLRGPLPAPRRWALSILLWSATEAIIVAGWTDSPVGATVGIVTALATCVLVVSTAVDVMWQAVHDDQRVVLQLQHQLHCLRDDLREGIEQLHEVKGTIAGIASATELMRAEARLSLQHRQRLGEMVATEAARLQRLVQRPPSPEGKGLVDLDSLIQPVVANHLVQGHHVEWHPPAVPLQTEVVELAEVVNILLQNAAAHAPGSRVVLYTRVCDDAIELVVADDGPGVPSDRREEIFGWGRRSETSPGQGVGLAMAQRLLTSYGHTIRLDDAHAPGAAFVVDLTRTHADREHGDDSVLVG